MSGEPKRFADTGEDPQSFADETLLVCPRCSRCAVSRPLTEPPALFSPRRLVCRWCGHSREWYESTIRRGWDRAVDDYFGLALWLQTPCCGETLWAWNAGHLEWLERFIASGLRERGETTGRRNSTMASRLPRWIKAGANREELLKGIERLREKLAESD